jgi:hypothetical protein
VLDLLLASVEVGLARGPCVLKVGVEDVGPALDLFL